MKPTSYTSPTLTTSRPFIWISLTASIFLFSANALSQDVEFQYSGDDGPSSWGELSSQWETCSGISSDAIQSPIDIKNVWRDRTLRALDLDTYPTTVNIFNNGHTIEQRYEGTGSTIYWDGIDYELNQFHFHTLSEHTVNNNHAAMELHAVFTSVGGKFLVIGQLFTIGQRENHFIQSLIDSGLPMKNGDESLSDTVIDLSDVLKNTRSYYTYTGSLTTPPCTEGVTWILLKRPNRLTAAQYESFRSILGNNFRPSQQLNDRMVRSTPGKHRTR